MMQKHFYDLCFLGLLVSWVGMFCFAVPQSAGAQDKTEKVFRLAHIESFKPFAVAQAGKSEGLAIDILEEALARVNLKVVFIGEHQDKVQDLLVSGKADGIAFLGIDAKRKETYDFSAPYLITGGALFVKYPGPSSSDLRQFERKAVVTPKEGPLAGFIQKNFPKVHVLTEVKDYTESLKAVLDGKADAAALNTQAGAVLANELFAGKFSLPEKGFLEVPIGVGVFKSKHSDFLMKVNEGLKRIMADGTYDGIIRKWGVAGATKPR